MSATRPPTDPRQPPGRPIAAVLAVVLRNEQVLLVQRAHAPDAGLWGFPGGRIESGESIEQAALRELQEETGVVAKAYRAFTALDAVSRDPNEYSEEKFILIGVLCSWTSGEPLAADDAIDAKWFPLADLVESDSSLSLKVAWVAQEAARLLQQEQRRS